MYRFKTAAVFLFTLIVILALHFTDIASAANKFSADDWSSLLQEAGIADAFVPERLAKSSEALKKVDQQTKGSLTLDKWIEIFRKLGNEPKRELKLEEWARLLQKAGFAVKPGAATTPVKETANPSIPSAPPSVVQQQSIATVKASETVASSAPVAVTAQTSTGAPFVQTATPPPPKPQTADPAVIPSSATTENEFAAIPSREEASASSPKASNKITLDLRGLDVLSALKIISSKTDLSIAATSSVKGNVTIYLKDIDVFDALKIILEMNDLAYVREDNVIKVMSGQDYEKLYGKKFSDKTSVELIRLNFAKAASIEKLISPVKSKVGQVISDPSTNSLILIDTPANIDLMKKVLSNLDVRMVTKVFSLTYTKPKEIAEKLKNIASLGISDIQVDEKNSLVVVTDFPEKVDEITKLIGAFDRRHKEVLIEARIVSIMLNNQFKMGVNWESVFSKVNNYVAAGKVTGNFSALATGASGLRLTVGTLDVNNFTAVYDALQSVGKTDLVSSPRIATLENEEAKILVGTKEAYVTTTVTTSGSGVSTTAESVTFVDVGVKLYVTPVVSDDGFISMKIRPEVSSVERTILTSQGNSIPIVKTSQAETSIMVKDGVTVVLAGLMEEKKVKTTDGVPLLSRIPLLGLLFRRTSDETMKTELAIFLTPHIMTGDVSNNSFLDKNNHKK